MQGYPSIAIAHQEQQLLTTGEEDVVADWCRRMSDRYFPVTILMLVSIAIFRFLAIPSGGGS